MFVSIADAYNKINTAITTSHALFLNNLLFI